MLRYERFRFTGTEQRWTVPDGVTTALFECWGAAGALPSSLAFEGKTRQVVGGTGPKNNVFYNNPHGTAQLGASFANGAGYATGVKTVNPGDVYYVVVGGNGGPGHSTIKLKTDGNYEVAFRGGLGGYNGGADGGKGAHVSQNLYDSASDRVHFRKNAMPNAAKVGQLWHDTGSNLVKKCNHAYTGGTGQASYWDQVTHTHSHASGPSGGGGGGATDIRFGGDAISNRILVAGGGGGAGGTYNKTGSGSWSLHRVPGTPAPPFGTDDTSTNATGPDNTWCTSVNYLQGSWGLGGVGGGSGPKPNTATTPDTGYASSGGAGGSGTNRHQDGSAPKEAHGSGGKGGTALAGGARGHGGSGAASGSKGSGGTGADAAGGNDDWCAGGGGGGGGYFGGGGGGQGFKVSGQNSGIHTRGGGGGGGSNYVDPSFSQFFLGGAAQPPFGKSNLGTGANGHGGFARISYRMPPTVTWKTAPAAVAPTTAFTVVFDFTPAVDGGPGIDHYIIGTSATPTDTVPTSQTTYMVTDPTLTEFSHVFTSPAASVQQAYFVQVVDKDGDASAWLRQKVTGLTTSQATPVTITAPTAGAVFEDTATVTWTVGVQSPLVAVRVGLSGTTLESSHGSDPVVYSQQSGWRRGGSRVNFAIDPGFEGSAVWSSTANFPVAPNSDHPGVSGSNGKIGWVLSDNFDAENHTTTLDNLIVGTEYRLHLGVASNLGNDMRPVQVQVWDVNGLLAHDQIDLSATAAGTYVTLDLKFTPTGQGVYFVVLPSSSGVGDADPLLSLDFEDGTTTGVTAAGGTLANDTSQTYQGNNALHITGFGSGKLADVPTPIGLTVAGNYVAQAWAYYPSASDRNPTLGVSGTGVTNSPGTVSAGTRDTWLLLRMPFTWDGIGTAEIDLYGDNAAAHSGVWYDLIEVYTLDDDGNPTFGCADTNQATYLKDMLVEMTYEEDSGGFQTYFDGSHTNGNPGTASWAGATNGSASKLTGTDLTSTVVDYSGGPLSGGEITLDTITAGAVVSGGSGVEASVAATINPNPPATPTVTLTVSSDTGFMVLAVNAADGAQPSTNKTVSFDIFRNGTRIVTGLTPDVSTRLASYSDNPAHLETATYVVRAWSQAGGYADQTDGTVN